MTLNFKLVPEAVVTVRAGTKDEILALTADQLAAVYSVDREATLEGLELREKLGSTGFGRGVAIPHARSNEINRPVVVALRLEAPVDFDSADAMPVDIVFGMLSPENAGATHLHALAALSRMVRDEGMHRAMIEAPDEEALYALMSNQLESNVA